MLSFYEVKKLKLKIFFKFLKLKIQENRSRYLINILYIWVSLARFLRQNEITEMIRTIQSNYSIHWGTH